MSLNIENGTLWVERINHPSDFYLYFTGGFLVWNYSLSSPLGIWLHDDLFTLRNDIPIEELHRNLSAWIITQTLGKQCKSMP